MPNWVESIGRIAFVGVRHMTEYGKFLRKLRIDLGVILKDMAETLEISAAYLSAIENGSKKVPEGLTESIVQKYSLTDEQAFTLEELEAQANRNIVMLLPEQMDEAYLGTALKFARDFSKLDKKQLEGINKILASVSAKGVGHDTGKGMRM